MPASPMVRVRTGGERCSGGGLRTGASSGLKGDRDIPSSPLNEGGAVLRPVVPRRHMELSRAIHPTASGALDGEKAQDGGES